MDLNNRNRWNSLTESDFRTNFRLTRDTFTRLLAEINCKEVNCSKSNLLVCLWFLGTTRPIEDSEDLFDVPETTDSLLDTFKVVLNFGEFYLKWFNADEALKVEGVFRKRYKFPGVVGVLGSLCLSVNNDSTDQILTNEGIILQAVVDCNLLFRDVCVGCPTGTPVADILKESPLYERLLSQQDNVLEKSGLHILGGTEHCSLKTLLTPLKGVIASHKERIYNELHGRVMVEIEKAFQELLSRFPRLTALEEFAPGFSSIVAGAACVLHNFVRIYDGEFELPVP